MDGIQERFNEAVERHSGTFPVQVIDIANYLGINVYQTNDLRKDIAGFIHKEENGNFAIYVNESQPPTRKLFTIAHEIGHYVRHFNLLKNGNPFITYKKADFISNQVMARLNNPAQSEEYRVIETEANKFAAELLMPKSEFVKVATRFDEIEDIANYFGVSCSAASIRANELGMYFI